MPKAPRQKSAKRDEVPVSSPRPRTRSQVKNDPDATTLHPISSSPRTRSHVKNNPGTVAPPAFGQFRPRNRVKNEPNVAAPSVAIRDATSGSDLGTFIGALHKGGVTGAVSLISAKNYPKLSGDIMQWANSPVLHRGERALTNFMLSLAQRAAREAAFSNTAVRVFQDLNLQLAPHTVDNLSLTSAPRGVQILRYKLTSIVDATILTTLSKSKNHGYNSAVNASATISDEEFQERCKNADMFIGRLLKAGLVLEEAVCKFLGPDICSIASAYERLVTLGPFLDARTKKSPGLDNVIHAHVKALNWRFNGGAGGAHDGCLEVRFLLFARMYILKECGI
jgi:hypothetical protein